MSEADDLLASTREPGEESMSSFQRLILASLMIPGQLVGDGKQEEAKQAAARLAIMKSEAARYTFLGACPSIAFSP